MYRALRAALLVTVATIAAFSFAGGGVLRPDSAEAHRNCYDFWQHSGHVDNTRWYHCHNWRTTSDGTQDLARVHICGYSGTLHGITVGHIHQWAWPDRWATADHAHDVGGEGC
jgi:hypothetical protein